jgi:5-methylcytosine-specific restriction endonuclease McrA
MSSGNKGQSRNKEDITGQVFESLTALRPVGSKLSQTGSMLGTLWECQCTCGNLRVVLRKHLGTATKKCEECVAKTRVCNLGGYKRPFMYTPVMAAVKLKSRNYQRHSKHAWKLSEALAFHLFTQECFYCDKIPSLDGPIVRTGDLMGIDRVDSALDYTVDNCVTACKQCNYAKNDLTTKQFFDLIKAIARKHSL